MSGLELVGYLTEIPFVIIFLVVAVQAFFRPRRATIDIALFFGAIVAAFVFGWIADLADVTYPRAVTILVAVLILGLPYLMVRLVADFAGAPALVLRAGEAGLIASAVGLWLVDPPYPLWFTEALVGYWVALQTYVTVRFWYSARTARGVAERRLQSITFGSLALTLSLATAGLRAAFPEWNDFWTVASSTTSLLAGFGFLFGFAPPRTIRRGWQAPEFRAFVARGEQIARLARRPDFVREIEAGVVATVGSDHAALILWDPERQAFVAPSYEEAVEPPRSDETFVEQIYRSQSPAFSLNAPRDYPAYAEELLKYGAQTMFGVPVTTTERRYGVLIAYSRHSPLFAEEDLSLLVLIARQVALQLWMRETLEGAASLAAREEATQLKEDFLSAAAHDLKTPLTTLLGQTQLMERRIARNPERPPDREGFQRMAREALRMRALIDDLLDASRPEEMGFVTQRTPTELGAMVRDVIRDRDTELHRFAVECDGPVVADVDEARLRQVVQNLVDNAVKYSPAGGEVTIRLARLPDAVELAVTDQGIGIDAADLPQVFQRFYRGSGVNDRKFGGMGLGLYLVDRIVREHGGDVSVASRPGEGSTFTVRLPTAAEEAAS